MEGSRVGLIIRSARKFFRYGIKEKNLRYSPILAEMLENCASYYPNLSIQNGLRPEHLGESFTKIYNQIYEERKTIPKSNPLNGSYKLMLNGSYGKSNEDTSFFYDPMFTMSID